MSKFFVVHLSRSGLLSVDCFGPKRSAFPICRTYWTPTPASIGRLRAVYRKDPKKCYVLQGWSRQRVEMYKAYGRNILAGPGEVPSLDSLSTSGRGHG